MLLKRQRNELFTIIVDNDLNPAQFIESNTETVYELKVVDASFIFKFTETNGKSPMGNQYSKANYYPRVDMKESDERVGVTWDENIPYFKKWAGILNGELNSPDLWAEAQANSKLFTLDSSASDELFNDSELRQLQGQVRQLVQGLMTLGLPANAQKLLTETVNEIPDKATRFTKKELTGWFMGAFAAQVTNLALSQEHVSAIATLIKTTFMGILQLH